MLRKESLSPRMRSSRSGWRPGSANNEVHRQGFEQELQIALGHRKAPHGRLHERLGKKLAVIVRDHSVALEVPDFEARRAKCFLEFLWIPRSIVGVPTWCRGLWLVARDRFHQNDERREQLVPAMDGAHRRRAEEQMAPRLQDPA